MHDLFLLLNSSFFFSILLPPCHLLSPASLFISLDGCHFSSQLRFIIILSPSVFILFCLSLLFSSFLLQHLSSSLSSCPSYVTLHLTRFFFPQPDEVERFVIILSPSVSIFFCLSILFFLTSPPPSALVILPVMPASLFISLEGCLIFPVRCGWELF